MRRRASLIEEEGPEPEKHDPDPIEPVGNLDELKEDIKGELAAEALAKKRGIPVDKAKEEMTKTPEERQRDEDKLLMAGALRGAKADVVPAEAIDLRETIGRTLHLVAAVPVEILDVQPSADGENYTIELREKGTRKVGTINVGTAAFQTEKETAPRNLGTWMRRCVNAALGKRLDL